MLEELIQEYLHKPVENLFDMLEERKFSEKSILPLLLLGRAYQLGVSGAPKDDLSAYFFFQAASEWGCEEADDLIDLTVFNGLHIETLFARLEEEPHTFLKGCLLFEIGYMYQFTELNERMTPKMDQEERNLIALKYYKQAAANGNLDGMIQMNALLMMQEFQNQPDPSQRVSLSLMNLCNLCCRSHYPPVQMFLDELISKHVIIFDGVKESQDLVNLLIGE